MPSFGQHYRSITSSYSFMVGILGIGLAAGTLVGGMLYVATNGMGPSTPKPIGKHAQAIKIEDKLTNRYSMNSIDKEVLDEAKTLRTELKILNNNPEVIEAKQERNRREKRGDEIIDYCTWGFAGIYMASMFPLGWGNSTRKKKLQELLD